MNFNSSNVYVVGAVDNPLSQIIRVVHISDTMGCETKLISQIPFGHILIHSGDFGKSNFFSNLWRSRAFLNQIDSMNKFFGHLPHPHKIYIAGSHDTQFASMDSTQVQSLLPTVKYLQDSSCQLYSLSIFGTPWIRRKLKFNNAFTKDTTSLSRVWQTIPSNTDILVSHQTPWMDSEFYKQISGRIKPILHLYGKNDGNYGVLLKDDIVFSNGSFQSYMNNHRKRYKNDDHHGIWSSESLSSFNNNKLVTCFSKQRLSRPDFYISTNEFYEPIVFDVYVPPEADDNFESIEEIQL